MSCSFIFFLFLVAKKKDIKNLLFGYFNIAYSFPAADEVLLEKISRISLPLTALFITLFVVHFTVTIRKFRMVTVGLVLPNLVASLVILFQNSKISVYRVFNIVTLFPLAPTLLFGFVLPIISATVRKKRGLLPVLASFFIMAKEQSETHQASLARARELDKIMSKIAYVSEDLVHSGSRLDEVVTSSVQVIRNNTLETRGALEKIINRMNEIENVVNRTWERFTEANVTIPLALKEQSELIDQLTFSIEEMNKKNDPVFSAVDESKNKAGVLAEIAEHNSKAVEAAKKSLRDLRDFSLYIRQILSSIEEIAEQTHMLSINAVIEAARAGTTGKGFKIVSDEIGKLALLSKTNLVTSFSKLQEINQTIDSTNELNESVYNGLSSIIDEAKRSAEMVTGISGLIALLKEDAGKTAASISRFEHKMADMKSLFEREQRENESINGMLQDLKGTFEEMLAVLDGQTGRSKALEKYLMQVNDVTEKNKRHIEILKGIVKGEGISLENPIPEVGA